MTSNFIVNKQSKQDTKVLSPSSLSGKSLIEAFMVSFPKKINFKESLSKCYFVFGGIPSPRSLQHQFQAGFRTYSTSPPSWIAASTLWCMDTTTLERQSQAELLSEKMVSDWSEWREFSRTEKTESGSQSTTRQTSFERKLYANKPFGEFSEVAQVKYL